MLRKNTQDLCTFTWRTHSDHCSNYVWQVHCIVPKENITFFKNNSAWCPHGAGHASKTEKQCCICWTSQNHLKKALFYSSAPILTVHWELENFRFVSRFCDGYSSIFCAQSPLNCLFSWRFWRLLESLRMNFVFGPIKMFFSSLRKSLLIFLGYTK